MNFSQIREYTTGLIKKAFANKKQLDKIGESPSGNLMFGDTEINAAGTIINNTYNGKLSYAENYSTEEQIVGRWINGKPIYSKTIYVSESDLGNIEQGRYYYININKGYPENVENLIDVKGFVNVTGNYPRSIFNLNISNFTSSAIGYIWQPEDNRITISLGDSQDITEATIVMSYTKTTDAENSFRPDMLEGATFTQTINNNNTLGYQDWLDTEEKVVGRYIDGRPLYQKTYYATQADNPEYWDDDNNVVFPFDLSHKYLVNATGYYRYYANDLGATLSYINSNTLREIPDKSGIVIRNDHQNTSEPRSALLTIQYYKDTDEPNSFDPSMLEGVIVDKTYTGEITYESYYNIGERVIGRWIDGKPIYRCIRKFDTPLSSNWFDKYQININSENNNQVINFLDNCDTPIHGIAIGYTITDNIRHKLSTNISVRVENTNLLYLTCVANINVFYCEYICIDYTKTTDAENSFVPSLINNEEETVDIPAAIAADTIILNTYDSETEEQTEP